MTVPPIHDAVCSPSSQLREGDASAPHVDSRKIKYMPYLLRIVIYGIFLYPVFSQVYEVGDTLSLYHQLLDLEICANGNGQSSLQLADFNFNLNGGDRYILWLDIFAPT